MSENRISHLVDTLDISKMTAEELQAEEEKFLAHSYICPKCKSIHMHNTNLEGKVCFPHEGDHYCDGVLRRMTSADIDDMEKPNE